MDEASYKEKLFFRCSYLIRHFYADPVLAESQPDQVNFEKLSREILLANPIVTIYELAWKGLIDTNIGCQQSTVDAGQFKNINMFDDDCQPMDKNDERQKLLTDLQAQVANPQQSPICD